MSLLGDADLPALDVAAEATHERRRPGRIEPISPELIPLLRNPTEIEIRDDATVADHQTVVLDRDDLGAARGSAVAVLLAVPLWCLIALVVWYATR